MGGNQGSLFYLKNLTVSPLKDLNEAALIIDKGHEMSEILNKKLNYTVGIRQN
jgi:hypothetical protein